MRKKKVYKTSDVFGVSRDLPLNYVERKSVDDKLVSDLSLDKHVIIYGSSKQGKTSLRKHCLQDDDYILIQCQNNWGLNKLAEGILKEAGYEVTISNEKTVENKFKLVAKVSAKLKMLGFGEASAESQAGVDNTIADKTVLYPLSIDPSDPNDLVGALEKIRFKKFIVLEDFHYLPAETQKDYSFFLKTLHERSQICFVIVAVWREENRLIVFNGDLSGRLVSVDADEWSPDELREVVKLGEGLLNISFNSDFIDEVISGSLGSVYVVQEVCRRACEDAGIFVTQVGGTKLVTGNKGSSDYIGSVVSESGPRYTAFMANFADGFQVTELQMYRWLLYPILKSTVSQLEKGLDYRFIRETLEDVHPLKSDLNAGNVTQALTSVPALQAKKSIKPFVLDYDQANKKLSIVDKGFLIWLSAQDRSLLLDDLDLPH